MPTGEYIHMRHTMSPLIVSYSIFCKIIAGKIPSMKLYDSDKTYAFLDIGPIAPKHCLIIPKYHGAKLHDIPDEHLNELLPVAKRIAKAAGVEDYNILQNNGRIAHQVVDHVHCKQSKAIIHFMLTCLL